ncbi:MAG: hypothetical protein HY741_23695 [Chloroflexi bacterium]|nr:hypothetical protein [Chloroflexota bacterium]
MNLFSLSDLKALNEAHASDPAYDLARRQARNQLVWLHERIYGEMRARRWDVHFRPEWSISPAQVSAQAPSINALRLRYTKAEYVARLMQKQFGGPPLTWEDLAWLGIGLDGQGVFVEWNIPATARLDAQNFYNKLVMGAPEKRTLRQILAELGGEGTLSLRQQGQVILNVRCARLVDLNVLNNTLEKFVPGMHDWNIAMRLLVTDTRLATNAAPDELLYRLAQLYGLHQFAVWSPRNNFLDRAREQPSSGIAP